MSEVKARLKQGDLMIAGEIDERLPAVTNGLIAHFPFDGTIKGYNANPIMDYSIWKDGQTGSIGDFTQYSSNNRRVTAPDPWGKQTVVWESYSIEGSTASGGIYYKAFPIDNTKMYRMSWWEKRVTNASGTYANYYAGLNGYGSVNGVFRVGSTSPNTNPYFWSCSYSSLIEGEWFLVVGHVHPVGYTGGTHPDSGRYNPSGRIGNISYDYVWMPETTTARSRNLALYQPNSVGMLHHTVYPRIDICDGTEPSIQDLLNGEGNIYNPFKIRYIRDYTNGSTANTSNHWVELQAFTKNGTNVAAGKGGTSSAGTWNALLTNNVTTSSPYWGFTSGEQWVQVDLGIPYDIEKIKIWHYYSDGRTYHKTKTQVSQDGSVWYTIFDSDIDGEYKETLEGKTHIVNLDKVKEYVLSPTGLAIEEPTKNLIISPDTPRVSTAYNIGQYTLSENLVVGDVYTITLKGAINNGQRFGVWRDTGSAHWVWMTYDPERDIYIGSGTIPETAQSAKNKLSVYNYPSSGAIKGTIEWIQLEKKPFATSFVNGSRGNSHMDIPITLSSPLTVVLDFTPIQPNGYTVHVNGVLSTDAHIDNNRFLIWCRTTENYYRIRVDGSDLQLSKTDIEQGKRSILVAVSDGTVTKIYVNGILKGSISKSITIASKITLGRYSESYTYQGNNIYHSLSIYNKALSDIEIKKISNSHISLQSNGNIMCRITESPKIPNDVMHVPLTGHGEDKYHIINPSIENNIVYMDGIGAAWIGNATTNLAGNVHLGFNGDRWEKVNEYPLGLPFKPTQVYKRKKTDSYWGTFTSFIPTSPTPYNRIFTVSFWYYVESNYNASCNSSFLGAPASGNSIYTTISTRLYTNTTTPIKGRWAYYCETLQITTDAYSYNYFNGWRGGTIADGYHCYIADFQLEERSMATPFTSSSRGHSKLAYSLNLDMNAPWTIGVFAKPNIRAYRERSRNPIFEVGSYYIANEAQITVSNWNTSNNAIQLILHDNKVGATVPGSHSFSDSDLDNWMLFMLRFDGNTLWFDTFSVSRHIQTSRVKSWVNPIRNNIFIGCYGWEDSFNGYIKDAIFAKRCLTDIELEDIYRIQMRQKNGLQIQGKLIEGMVF